MKVFNKVSFRIVIVDHISTILFWKKFISYIFGLSFVPVKKTSKLEIKLITGPLCVVSTYHSCNTNFSLQTQKE